MNGTTPRTTRHAGHAPGRTADRAPGRTADRAPGRTAGRAPGRTAGHAPGRTAGRTAARAMAVSAAVALTLGGCGVMDIPSSSGTVTVWVDAPSTGGSSAPKPVPTVTSTQQAAPTSMVAGRAKGAVTSFSEAMHRIDGTRRSKDYSSFVSPSGNIFCIIGSGGAACEVRDGRIPSPVDGLCPAGGPTDVGRIELRPDGASPVCNNDTIRTGNAPKLSYRTRTHVSGTDVTCLSEEAGVTCVDSQNQHGFFLARGGFSTF